MEIRKSKARFLSIFFIVALGVAFFSGIQAASPDMRLSGDAYYDQNSLMDLKVAGTMGLTKEDVRAVEELEGVEAAEGAYSTDVLNTGTEDQAVLHVESVNSLVNRLKVKEGRIPDAKGECFLDQSYAQSEGYELGDVLTVEEEEDGQLLQVRKYEIVGIGSSPLYISFERGNTTLGSGEINGFVYVTEDNFKKDYYTQIYILARQSSSTISYTDAYDSLIEQVLDEVEGIEEERCQIRYTDIKEEAQEELDKAQEDLDEGKKKAEEELAEAREELEKGKQEYQDGQKKYEDGKQQLSDARKKIEDGKQQLEDVKAQINDGEKQLEEGKVQLSAAWTQYHQKEAEFNEGKKKLEDAKARLEEQQEAYDKQVEAAQIPQMKEMLEQQEGQLEAARQQYETGLAQAETLAGQITQVQGLLDDLNQQYQDAVDSGTASEEELAALAGQIQEAQGQLETLQSTLESLNSQLAAAKEQIRQGEEQLAAGKAQLEQAEGQFAQAKAQLDAAWKEIAAQEEPLAAAEAQLKAGYQELAASQDQLNQSESTLAASKAQIAANEKELEDGEKEIQEKEQELADARQELADAGEKIEEGEKEYREGEEEAQKEIREGEEKLADAKEELQKLEVPQWYVTDRNSLPEYTDFGENAERIRNIGKVFPVMFFLVAALISLTTMTRMVEEQRTQIGTLKALGYGKYSIASKYLNYAFLATLGGSIFGILFGEKVLPYIIIQAYGIMYHNIGDYMQIPYEFTFALIASVAAVVCTIGATLFACYKELAETPASLMRPPAPKEGKRVLMEKLPFIWNHLSFTWKSTIRNLIRYKKRFFMTVFGIAGSMALLLVGFGLQDSIMDIAKIQYTQLQLYDAIIITDEDADETAQAKLDEELGENEGLDHYTRILMKKMTTPKGVADLSEYLYVPEDMESFAEDIIMRDRKTKEQFTLDDSGVVISEKTASLTGVEKGDMMTLEEEGKEYQVPVANICENYMGHYIYMSPRLYEEVFQEKPEYNDILITSKEESPEKIEKQGKEIMKNPAVLSISYTDSIEEQLERMLSSLGTVIVVLIVSAGMLAFVVLYNLNNINITERKRELATLKVLGFYDLEVSEYVFRENVLLTVIGIAAGAGLGILLHRFVITTVEVDACMFGRNIGILSFVYSGLYTAGFSAFVNFVMFFKLRKIDMVESLKSVE